MKQTNFTKFSFGLGALGKDLCYAMISYFLMIYFTDTVGMAPLFVGNLFLVARIWDAFNDPMMGFVVDNTRSKWGKFRPWILLGAVLNSIVMIFMFRKPAGMTGFSMYAYFSVMYILWGMTYTVIDIPYWSMLPSLSSTKEERDSMSVIPRIFASLAWLLMGAFAIKMVSMLGNGDDAKGYSMLAVGIAVVFVVTSVITVVFVKDRSCFGETGDKKAERTTVKDALHVIMANDQLKVFIGVVLCYNLVVQLAGGVAIYYFTYVAGDKDLYPIFTTAAQFAEIGALFLFPVLSKGLSKKQVFAIASFSPAIGLVGLVVSGFFAPQNVVIIAVCGVLYKLGSGLTLGATTVMLADVIDYGQVKLGSRNESIIASFQTLLVKTASAVSAWLIGVGLTIVGYVANTEQSAATIMGMRVLMGVIPAVITVLAFVIYVKGYKLDGAFLEEILSKVNKSKKTEV
ncbi:melibiose:sodium transporter MelB [Fusicatenibacter saccharivorans]|jgi:melibiose permease|uniref:melibiose:sodium transporter MelB n=1 Tax=Fusicatenibacter saccharivorans TaxID=1150298 RepID=UPI0006C15BDE|nr:Thiomethylgalactoside permease II [Fusicatenibacter saccharivorans]